jgi:CubicO group peptidase (beta-lactamase class C family)
MRRVLLVSGIAAAVLYGAMLVFVPMQWEGYSSASQAISELSAIGAPTRPLWVALGMIYTLLIALFGLGVWSSARRPRALRVAGTALVVSGIFGLFWPPMHLRGTEFTLTDTLHIVWTMVTLLLMLVTIASGAMALGKRFRLYSVATILLFVVFGGLTWLNAPLVAANLPTTWMGVWERANVGLYLLWVVVFAIALLRGLPAATAERQRRLVKRDIGGRVAPGFEEVRVEFERNFVERDEIGAAVAAYWRGEKVVDLWGGNRTPEGNEPWLRDTMVVVMSTTKGLAAMTLAVANARSWLDYDAPVARYWPEFAQNRKGSITVRQLLGHEAGLVVLDEQLTIDKVRDLDYMAHLLARQTPAWAPGTRHGYHTMTLGLYMQELIRRVDPKHRSLGRFFHEEIAEPLRLDFHIGLPRDIPDQRLAKVKTLTPWRGILALRYTPPAVTLKMLQPGSLLRKTFMGLGVDPNDRRYLEIEVPAGNGVGTARAIARAYSAFAGGGAELGVGPETLARLIAPPQVTRPRDEVLGLPSYYSLGFIRPGPDVAFGSSPRAFGTPGAGGSFGFADPDARLGYAYVMNKLDFHLVDDPREKALRDAVYRAIARTPVESAAWEHGKFRKLEPVAI